MNDTERWKRYQELRHRVLDRMADSDQVAEFEQLILSDTEIKRDFAEMLHQESALSIRGEERSGKSEAHFDRLQSVSPAPAATEHHWFRYAILAASMILMVSTAVVVLRERKIKPVVMLTSTQNCQWGATTLATMPGQALPPGRLVLTSGIAELKFPLVDVTMEGPADVEILSADRCLVRSGRIYAKVHPGGEGFVVETPTSELTDQGTVFAVNVSPQGTSDLQVFDGLVDAKHLGSGKTIEVRPESGLRLSHDKTESLDASFESLALENLPAPPLDDLRRIQISTAVGHGHDGYVIAGAERATTRSEGMLLVKETPVDDRLVPWRRRAYMHFDLSTLNGGTIREAKLQLQGAATGLGYLAITPDTTFAVYGLTDEAAEDWNSDSLTWAHSPGFLGEGKEINPAATVLLGRFTVPKANTTDVFSIDGEKLSDFLKADTNGGATMILVSETAGPGECYAHGFASSRHRDLQPPTLRLGIRK